MTTTAIITYTVTPCPACGVNMPGVGTVTRNGSDLWDGLIWCDHCGYSVSGSGDTEFFAAGATAKRHQTSVKRSGRERLNGKSKN